MPYIHDVPRIILYTTGRLKTVNSTIFDTSDVSDIVVSLVKAISGSWWSHDLSLVDSHSMYCAEEN